MTSIPRFSEKAEEMRQRLAKAGFAVKCDLSEKSPGWKFSEQEIKGIPLRIEIGPKDIEKGIVTAVRRDTREKTEIPFEKLEETVGTLLEKMQEDMLEKAKKFLASHISEARTYEEFKENIATKPGFVKMMWCGDEACEKKAKEDTTATSRCMPFGEEPIGDVCPVCGKPAKALVYWGKAY